MRKVHLRTQGVINLGSSKTYCGRVIDWAPMDTAGAVISFADFDATVHGTLVTCERCLPGTYHSAAQGMAPEGRGREGGPGSSELPSPVAESDAPKESQQYIGDR